MNLVRKRKNFPTYMVQYANVQTVGGSLNKMNVDICPICNKEIKDGQLHIEDSKGNPTHHYECYGKGK